MASTRTWSAKSWEVELNPTRSKRPPVGEPRHAHTDEFLGRVPLLAWRGVIYVVLLFLSALGVWSWHSRVKVVVSGPARLVSPDAGRPIQAPVAGRLSAIEAELGAEVAQGQILARLRSPEVARGVAALQRARATLAQAERDQRELLPARLELLAGRVRLLAEHRASIAAVHSTLLAKRASLDGLLDAKRTQHRGEKAARRHAVAIAGLEVESATLALELARATRKAKAGLNQQGLIRVSEWQQVLNAERAAEVTLRRRRVERGEAERLVEQHGLAWRKVEAEHEQTVLALDESLRRSSAEQLGLRRQERELGLSILKERQTVAAALEAAQAEAERAERTVAPGVEVRGDEVLVRAPGAGIVTVRARGRLGAEVALGTELLRLVPLGVEPVAEVLLGNAHIAHVRLGQEARLKLDAYPFAQHGVVLGTVAQIPPDLEPEVADQGAGSGSGASTPSYRLLVALDRSDIPRGRIPRSEGDQGDTIPLRLGLTGKVEIVTDRRRLIRLFLQPVEQLLQDGLSLDR